MEGDITVSQANRKLPAITGTTRRLKDNAADWHNLMARWEKLNEDGFTVAGNIVAIALTRPTSDQLLGVDESSSPPPPSPVSGGAAELQDECCKLQDVIDKMVVVVKKMERLTALQQGVQDLEEFQFGLEGRKIPLFHSWNAKHFKESSCVLLESFSQELKLKQTILQELAHTATSDLSMIYMSCWLHQPFITPQTRLTLEAVLLETGHHPL
ncbi:cyclin-dependent kinase 2-interacting protein isoform X2 [Gasterosteus aculeatus]|uniref:cyclin-dependent kinase 2-interacting protein n=1 Tax=Gasterosteus aculeatus aculeatus TaxID=481459 RepID=UPI001A9969D8|nr:cyclin-dependent kinase 2-interacting protein [Gasterosteus aculeatus aculeatus]